MADTIPLINGFRHQWADVEIRLRGTVYTGVKSVNYSTETDGADIYGTSSEKIGMTQGNAKHDASIELYEDEARAFLTAQGNNYLGSFFDVVIHKSNNGRTYTDKLIGCVIKKVDDSHSEGAEALTTKFDLRVTRIKRGGVGGIDLKAVISAIVDLF